MKLCKIRRRYPTIFIYIHNIYHLLEYNIHMYSVYCTQFSCIYIISNFDTIMLYKYIYIHIYV